MDQMDADVVGDSVTLPGDLGKVAVLPAGTVYHKRGRADLSP